MTERPIEISVVIPCLNEESTLAECIREAKAYFKRSGCKGEVIVADNGSTDRSWEIAKKEGARIVEAREKGYGSALRAGFTTAKGKWIVFADADGSYPFDESGSLLDALVVGADVALGSRLKGKIEPGAMPLLNRYLGTPVLTLIHRIFFGTKISDSQTGMRAFRREILPILDLRTTGMELASEMLVKASLLKLKISEAPIHFRKDRRDRPPHLRPWRDGWRHLRFLLLYSPRWLFIYPGMTLMVCGGMIVGATMFRPVMLTSRIGLDVHSLLCGALAVILGYQIVCAGVYARLFAGISGLLPKREMGGRNLFGKINLETGIILGLSMCAVGLYPIYLAVRLWVFETGFGPQDVSHTMRLLIPGLTLVALGVQTIFSSFMISLLTFKERLTPQT